MRRSCCKISFDVFLCFFQNQQGLIDVEGCLTEDYYVIRDLLYQQYAIVWRLARVADDVTVTLPASKSRDSQPCKMETLAFVRRFHGHVVLARHASAVNNTWDKRFFGHWLCISTHLFIPGFLYENHWLSAYARLSTLLLRFVYYLPGIGYFPVGV